MYTAAANKQSEKAKNSTRHNSILKKKSQFSTALGVYIELYQSPISERKL